MAIHIHRQGGFNNHTTHSLYRIMVTATSVVGVMKMGNTVPRVGLEPTSLAFWASVLLLKHVGVPDVTTSPTPYLRGQCRLLLKHQIKNPKSLT